MKEKMKLYRGLQIVIVIATVVGMLLVFPGNIFHHNVTTSMDAKSYQETNPLYEDNANIMQQFFPSQEHLRSITVMVDSLGQNTGYFKFRLYDQALNVLWENGRRFEDSPGIANYTFHVDQDLEVGQPYYYALIYYSTTFTTCYTEKNSEIQADNGILYDHLEAVPGGALISSYEYTLPLSVKRIMVYDVALLILGVLLCGALEWMGRRGRLQKNATSTSMLHVTGILVAAAGMIYALWQILSQHLFSQYLLENMVLSTGVLLTGAILIYGICHIQLEEVFLHPKKILKKIPDYLQILFWALALQGCVDFVNAGSNYAQGLGLRQMCIFFGLAVITMFTRTELCRIWNAIYAVLAVIAVVVYSSMFWGQGEPFQTAVRTALMWAVAGFVFIDTIYNLIHKKIRKFSWIFTIPVTLFFILMLVFRNGNIWEVAIVVPFTLFYIRPMRLEKMDQTLGNIANGIIVSFIITTVQALLYRPYHYYTMTRYSGIFMTVTVTAVYLSMIFAVALCKALVHYERDASLKSAWKDFLVMGLAGGYEFLTLSRTGMLSCTGVYVIIGGLYLLLNWKRKQTLPMGKLKNVICFLVYTAAAIALCIPVTYTASRTIPAIVNSPKIYVGEEFQDSIRLGEPVDSFRYITFGKVIGKSAERVLGKTDLSYVTQSGKTVEEVLEEAKKLQEQNQNAQAGTDESADAENQADILGESGVSINGEKLTYIDEYGSEYTIDNPDYSNGRLDIYKLYLKNLNLTGHATIGLPMEDGSIVVHAHNSFIQMAYDCGIITGIIFLFLYILLGFRSIWYYQKRKETDSYGMLPLIMFAVFGISSMVEYVFRPTIPLGFIFLLMFAPLMMHIDRYSTKEEQAELEQ